MPDRASDVYAALKSSIALYEGEIRYVDECCGRLMTELASLGLEDHTWVVVSTDHGEEMGDHGDFGHGQSLYEELVRVPLIIAGPGVVPSTVDQPVSAIDLVPTFGELMEVDPDPGWKGVSIATVLQSGESSTLDRPCFAGGNDRTKMPPSVMVVKGRYKLIRQVQSGQVELYDLIEDPGERANLAESCPELVAALNRDLDQWLQALHEHRPGQGKAGLPDDEMEQKTREQLETLGYL
jgi:choline-sulfatase